jgi:hypothetical protein
MAVAVRRKAIVVLLLVLGYLSVQPSAHGLPIFARRYQTSCMTCHEIIPKLNPFGVAFRNNGYRMPGNDEELLKDKDVALGAPDWKKLWPKAVWPTTISSYPPLAVRVMSDVQVRPSQPIHHNFEFPSGVAAYFAGPSGESFSFFGSVFITSQGTIAVDRAYGQFKLFGERPGSNWLSLKFGKIDNRAEPFSSSNRRSTIAHFNAGDYRAIPIDAYAFRDRDSGAELWGAATGPGDRGGLEYAAGVVQGTAARAENNNFKDYYGSVSYKFGGYGVVGPRKGTEALELSDNGSETSVQIGAFGYKGKSVPRVTGVRENPFNREGVKVDVRLRKLHVYGAALRGKDEMLGGALGEVKSSATFAEANYLVLPWVMPFLRYEKTNFSGGRRNIVQWIPGANLAIRANVRFVLEGHLFNRASAEAEARTGVNEAVMRLEFLF